MIGDDDDDVGRFRNSKKMRLRRKVLVKRQKSARQARLPKSVVGVKKLGLGAEIIPYQPTLLLRSVAIVLNWKFLFLQFPLIAARSILGERMR